jgi:hypothetical protein
MAITVACGEGKHGLCSGSGRTAYLIPQESRGFDEPPFACGCICHHDGTGVPCRECVPQAEDTQIYEGTTIYGNKRPLKFEMPTCWKHWRKGHKWWCRRCDLVAEVQFRDTVHALWKLQGAADRIVK